MYYWYLLPATVEMVGFAYPYPMLCAQIYDYRKPPATFQTAIHQEERHITSKAV